MPSKTTPGRQRRFLEAFEQCGVIAEAARLANIDQDCHWIWLHADPQYKAAFVKAEQIAADRLETELINRVYDGVKEDVWWQGQIVGATRKFSDTLLIFALKGAKPDKYREQWKGELQHAGALAISRGPDLKQLSNEQLQQLKQLALAAAADSLAHAGSGSDSEGGDQTGADENSDVLP